MDIRYIKLIKNNLRGYLFDGVISRTNPIDGPYFFHFVRFNYLIKAIYAWLFLRNVPISLNEEKVKATELLIIGHHYARDFCALEGNNQNITIVGLREEYNLAREKKWGFINVRDIYIQLAFTSWHGNKVSKGLLDALSLYEGSIKKMPAIRKVYVNADLLPFYRACLKVFSELKHVTIVCPQHGLYTTVRRIGETEGALADVNLVFDNVQGDFLINSGIDSNTIIINDYKLSDNFKSTFELKRNKDILIVSEGWHIVLGLKTYKYYWFLIRLWNICKKNGYNPILRPHPSERFIFKPLFFIKMDRGPLIESIKRHDVLLSCASSVLRQAKKHGKVAIQMEQEFYTNLIRMDKVGYATYNCKPNDLPNLLKELGI